MCGICGELRFEPAGDDAAYEFERLIDVMARRGPDDRGSWADGACRLGFRRLAILDLSPAANQPMTAAGCALVFNGEVYNFRELRAELEGAGITFATTGDTEVVLWALIQWGKAALDRFNGMFALGFYDGRRRSLLLARDAVGIKPLYALLDRQGVFFASQYDQIMAHPWGAGRAVSPAALGLYLRFGHVPAPYGILQGTEMLEPGSWLEVTADGRLSRGRYYEFPVYRQPDLRGAEADEAVNAAITAAVRRQLISDVPLGAFLSGGIDSPLVAAKAMEVSNRPLRAFTIGNEVLHLDETDDALDYGRQLGLDHVTERYTPDKAIEWLDRVIDACAEPVADFSIFPTMLVSSMARREVTVALSGDGGDELFWGYPVRFAAVLRQAEAFRQPYWLRAGRRAAQRLAGAGHDGAALRWPTIGEWYRAAHARLSDTALNAIFVNFPALPADFKLFHYDGWQQDDLLSFANFVNRVRVVGFKGENEKRFPEVAERFNQLNQRAKAAAEDAKKLKEQFPDYEFVQIPAGDMRDKVVYKPNGTSADGTKLFVENVKPGLLDGDRQVKSEKRAEAIKVLQEVAEYLGEP